MGQSMVLMVRFIDEDIPTIATSYEIAGGQWPI